MPACIGEAQAVFLELLAHRYRRKFTDVWDFVEWAEQNEPGIDMTSPPRRNLFRIVCRPIPRQRVRERELLP
jgi:hypothetical protein